MARPLFGRIANRLSGVAIAWLFACQADPDLLAPPYVWADEVLVADSVARMRPVESGSAEPLGRPLFVRAKHGLSFVADVTVDRVAVIDSSGRVVRWIGSRGRGPGELFGVGHLAVDDEHVFVAEALNGRVSEFDLNGAFVRQWMSPYAAGALVAVRAAPIAIARSTSHYAKVLRANDDGSLALRRVRHHAAAGSRWSIMAGHDLLAADSTRTWTFDQSSGEICAYDAPRATPRCRALPRDLLARLRDYRDRRVALLEAAIHQHVQAAPLAKDMIVVGPWLAMLLPLPDLPIILVHIADGTLTPITLRSLPLPSWVRAASSFAWDAGAFVLTGDEGIGRIHVSPLSLVR